MDGLPIESAVNKLRELGANARTQERIRLSQQCPEASPYFVCPEKSWKALNLKDSLGNLNVGKCQKPMS
jgi:hypothetical protein